MGMGSTFRISEQRSIWKSDFPPFQGLLLLLFVAVIAAAAAVHLVSFLN